MGVYTIHTTYCILYIQYSVKYQIPKLLKKLFAFQRKVMSCLVIRNHDLGLVTYEEEFLSDSIQPC